MEPAKVDIFVPTYRPNEEHLRAAMDSVNVQTEKQWRVFVQDEPTEVDTEEILRPYLEDERISYRKNAVLRGIGGNWNACLEHGEAEYIQYLFQDDLWHPEYLQRGIEILDTNPDVGFVSLGHDYMFEGEIPTKNVYHELKDFINFHLSEGRQNGIKFLLWWMEKGLHPNVIGEPSYVMLRRNTVKEVGKFREDMQQNLDSEYWTRMLAKSNWFYLPGSFGTFRVHEEAASMRNFNSGAGIFDRLRILKSATALLPKSEKRRAKQIQKRNMRIMVEKFIERYGKKHIRIQEHERLGIFLLRHPLLLIACIKNFAKKRKRA